MNKKELITLALLVGILPPIWAVASPYLGNNFGPVALIAAGIYGANGNKFSDAHKIALGYICGDIWALIATVVMQKNTAINADAMLFIILFILGFLAVIIANWKPNLFYMPSWLAGWAIGMLSMNLDTVTPLTDITVQVAIAMLVGVYYVGALLDKIHRLLNSR